MERFEQNGHLTDEALSSLVSGGLDELSRLEVSEHLSYCDRCLDRYLALLSKSALEAPAHSCREPLMLRIRRSALRVLESRLATAAAAVIIVVSLWSGGGIGALLELPAKITAIPTSFSESFAEYKQEKSTAGSFFDHLGDWMNGSENNIKTNFGGK